MTECFARFFQRRGNRKRRNGSPGNHRFAYLRVGKIKHAIDESLFLDFQMSALTRDVDQLSQLFFSVDGCMTTRRMQAKQPHRSRACPVKHLNRPAKDPVKDLHWQGDSEGSLFGALECESLWGQLAKHDVKKGDDAEGDRKSESVKQCV